MQPENLLDRASNNKVATIDECGLERILSCRGSLSSSLRDKAA
jgi:hypothetical protein